MAAPVSKKAQPSNSVSPPIIIAALVVLILFLGGMAWYFFAPHSGSAVHPRPLTTNESWLAQKAKESGGDISKLSPADQQHLFQVAGPSAPATLRMNYEAQRSN